MSTSINWLLHLQLRGRVQGVGFRPTVYRLAHELGLGGWIANSTDGLQIELRGTRAKLERALERLLKNPPPGSRIDQWQQHWTMADHRRRDRDLEGFRILPSLDSGVASALISPDLALCDKCQAELADPSSRRFRYPFISCTACGPRYSLLQALPFERANTSLAAFPLCAACAGDYANPDDRRFHAQTISCASCGPQLRWNQKLISLEPALLAASALLSAGGIVALQGVGGFQLLADPSQAETLRILRHRKGRPHKPLALLSTEKTLMQICHFSGDELALWRTQAAPILLLRRRTAAQLPEELAGDSPWLGVMRPASGLQQLLLEAFARPLVATSANRSGEPITCDAERDAACLEALADGVLSHQLPIINRIDDSVMRWAAGGPIVLRLGRGLAPLAIPNRQHGAPALAMGGHSKGAIAMRQQHHLVLSPDLGDLSSCAGAENFESTTAEWMKRCRLRPNAIAADLHPRYRSRLYAEHLSQGLPAKWVNVQHHHAHLLAVMAEHNLNGEATGLAWDGSGLGDDNTLWGGEALTLQGQSYRRIARLRPFSLPGGERALREPRRAALGLLFEAYGRDWRDRLAGLAQLPWLNAFAAEEHAVLEQTLQQGLHHHRCSSIGRLFDAVAALLGLHQICSFEAQAAMSLEGIAATALDAGASKDHYHLVLERQELEGLWEWDWEPLLNNLLNDLEQGRPKPQTALAFHAGLAEAAVDLALVERQNRLLLAGGCFQNKVLLELSANALTEAGIQALWCQQLPSNDVSLPIGQLLAIPTESPSSTAAFSIRAKNHN